MRNTGGLHQLLFCTWTTYQLPPLPLPTFSDDDFSTLYERVLIFFFCKMRRYSVGAHIAGLTSNFIKSGKLGRITGLDPTIIFYMSNNRSRDLDPTDAHFVDIIHTAAGILGQWGPSGHADFYVNGGTSQPGCASDSIIREWLNYFGLSRKF